MASRFGADINYLIGLTADRRASDDVRAVVIAKTLGELEKAACGNCKPGRPCARHCKKCRAGRPCSMHDETDPDEIEPDGDDDD